MMLDGRRDDVVARRDNAEDGKVVSLRTPAGKDHLGGAAAQQRRHRLTGALHSRARLLAVVVDGRCVAEVLAEVRADGSQHLRQHRSARIVVEVNSAHMQPTYFTPGMRWATPAAVMIPASFQHLRGASSWAQATDLLFRGAAQIRGLPQDAMRVGRIRITGASFGKEAQRI